MKTYKVTFNLPGSKFPTEITLPEERMNALYEAMNRGIKIVELDGNYFNTAYFIQAVQDTESMVFKVVQDKMVEKGQIETPEEQEKRIQLTQAKYGLAKKLSLPKQNDTRFLDEMN